VFELGLALAQKYLEKIVKLPPPRIGQSALTSLADGVVALLLTVGSWRLEGWKIEGWKAKVKEVKFVNL
jgi:hypothetical protein